jgi:hypothetical protein
MNSGMSIMVPTTPVVTYGGLWAPEDSPSVTDHRFTAAVPVLKDEKQNLAISVLGNALHIGKPLTLSKNNTEVPQDLYRTEMGVQYSRNLSGARNWGLRGTLGYASDKPFTNTRDMTFTLNASYSYPTASQNRWVLFLYMANNSSLPNYLPIPGFIYLYKTPTFTGMFGLPMVSMTWKPVHPLFLSLSLFGPTINAEIGAQPNDYIQIFSGFNWSQQSFLRDGREDRSRRLFLDEKRIFAGIRGPIAFSVLSELQVGQNFDRSIYEGKGFLKKDGGSVSLQKSWSLMWNFRYAF